MSNGLLDHLCWYDRACELNRPFFEKLKNNQEICSVKATRRTMVKSMAESIVRALEKKNFVYVVSELPSQNIVDELRKMGIFPADVNIYTYPTAISMVSHVRWGVCCEIEFVQSMNQGIMQKYKTHFSRCFDCKPSAAWVVDAATADRTLMLEVIFPLWMVKDQSYEFVVMD